MCPGSARWNSRARQRARALSRFRRMGNFSTRPWRGAAGRSRRLPWVPRAGSRSSTSRPPAATAPAMCGWMRRGETCSRPTTAAAASRASGSTPMEREDQAALGGKATLREITLTLAQPEGAKIHLLLVVPNGRTRPAPVFLGLNFNGNQGLLADPRIRLQGGWKPKMEEWDERRRGAESEAWALDQAVARGYAVATFYNGAAPPDGKLIVETVKRINTAFRPHLRPRRNSVQDDGVFPTSVAPAGRGKGLTRRTRREIPSETFATSACGQIMELWRPARARRARAASAHRAPLRGQRGGPPAGRAGR